MATSQGERASTRPDAVVFVKVDQSRWALAGINGKRDSISGLMLCPVYPVINWIDDMLL